MDISDEEFVENYLGEKTDENDIIKENADNFKANAEPIDWRDKKGVTAIKN